MAFEFDRPRFSSFATLQGYLDRLLDFLKAEMDILGQRQTLLIEALTSGLFSRYQSWDDSGSSAGDPGAGDIAGNNTNLNTITQFAVSATDVFGRTLSAALAEILALSDVLLLQNITSGKRHAYAITTFTDNGSWWQITVTSTAGDADNPTAGDGFQVAFAPEIV